MPRDGIIDILQRGLRWNVGTGEPVSRVSIGHPPRSDCDGAASYVGEDNTTGDYGPRIGIREM